MHSAGHVDSAAQAEVAAGTATEGFRIARCNKPIRKFRIGVRDEIPIV
jgi:hypothetical protein